MSDHSPIRIVIVDDHDVVRSGLIAFLETEDDLELVGEANSGQQALQICEQVQPDIVLMDVVMHGMTGAETTRRLREKYPHLKILGLTSFEEEALVAEMMRAGASGCLLKDVTIDALAAAIRNVAQNPPADLAAAR